jgi:hypothetical protein
MQCRTLDHIHTVTQQKVAISHSVHTCVLPTVNEQHGQLLHNSKKLSNLLQYKIWQEY